MYDVVLRYLARLWLEPAASRQLGFHVKPLADSLTAGPVEMMQVAHMEPGSGAVTQRQQIFTADASWQITLLGPGIDLAHSAQSPVSLSEFAERARTVFAAVFHNLDGANALRIAMITEGLLEDFPVAEKDAIASRLLTFPNVFAPAPWEWDWRCVASVERDFGGTTQMTNTIATVKRASGVFRQSSEPFDRLRVDVDINTPGIDPSPRFDARAVDEFVQRFPAWQNQLGESVLRTAGINR